jgi:hypothetical protein
MRLAMWPLLQLATVFLVVPTVRFRLLYAWFVIGHGRQQHDQCDSSPEKPGLRPSGWIKRTDSSMITYAITNVCMS